MRKGQHQLLVGLIVLAVIAVSIGTFYYFSFKPGIKSNQNTATTTLTTSLTSTTSSTSFSTTITQHLTTTTTQSLTISTTSTTTSSATTVSTTSTTTTTTAPALTWTATEKYQVIGGRNSYSPAILYDEGIYKMWFGGYWNESLGDFDRISYAYSNNLINWTVVPAIFGPIRIPNACPSCPNGVAEYGVNDPTVIRSGGTLIMYFTAVHANVLDPMFGINELWVAYSWDGINWFAATPVKNITINELGEPPNIGVPGAVMINGRLYIYVFTYNVTAINSGNCCYRILMKTWDQAENYINLHMPPWTSMEFVNNPKGNLTLSGTDIHANVVFSESVDGLNWLPFATLINLTDLPHIPGAQYGLASTTNAYWLNDTSFWLFFGLTKNSSDIYHFKIQGWKFELK